jgi:DHA1 family multidrug resistance protein-like MFS transporter
MPLSKRDLAVDTLVRPFTLNFQEPIEFALNVYIGLIYALLYIWFESFPVVFIGIYHWREQLLGLSFLGLFVGAFLVMPPFFAYLYYVQEPKYNENGELKPEECMPVAIVGTLLVPHPTLPIFNVTLHTVNILTVTLVQTASLMTTHAKYINDWDQVRAALNVTTNDMILLCC